VLHRIRQDKLIKLASMFFKDTEPLLVGVGNLAEMETRLRWLSDGALHYHLKDTKEVSESERSLYRDFIDWVCKDENNLTKQ